MISTKPIRPAIRPFCSCSLPKVAEICCSDCTVKFSGKEPKDSWFASELAAAWVKPWVPLALVPPEICALPPVIADSIPGAETVKPSSTMANWFFCGAVLSLRYCSRRVEILEKSAVPCLLNSRDTIHWLVFEPWLVCSSAEVALVRSVPLSSAGPRM